MATDIDNWRQSANGKYWLPYRGMRLVAFSCRDGHWRWVINAADGTRYSPRGYLSPESAAEACLSKVAEMEGD